MNNTSLYNGFYWVKIKNLGELFKEFNGRDFGKRLKDMEAFYDRVKPPKGLKDNFPEILEKSNRIREDITHQIESVKNSDRNLDEFKNFYEYIIRFRKIDDEIQSIKKNIQEVEILKNEMEKLKEKTRYYKKEIYRIGSIEYDF